MDTRDKLIAKLEELIKIIDDLYIVRSAMATYVDVNEYKPEYRKLITQEESMYFKNEKLRKEIASLKDEIEAEKEQKRCPECGDLLSQCDCDDVADGDYREDAFKE